MAEGSRKGELARVEGIIEVDVDGVLRYLSFGDVYAFRAVVLMSVQRLRREINHVKAISVAVRVEIKFKVLALAGKLCGIDSHTGCQSAIRHSHTQRTTAVSHHVRAVLHALRHRCGLHVSPREIASELDGPSGVGT